MSDPVNGVILIVDDNPKNLEVLSECLDEAGFDVRVALDGENALRKASLELPDLIILDVMMPGLDGFSTCERLKASPQTKDIPVIFMTALAETEDKVKGFNAGAVDYITKPFRLEEVIARVKLHLSLRSMTKQLQAENQARRQAEERLRHLVEQQERQLAEAEHHLMELEIQLFEQHNFQETSWFKVFEKIAQKLRAEVQERKIAQEELLKLKDALELEVAQRTAELQQRNEELKQNQAILQKQMIKLSAAVASKQKAMLELEAANQALKLAKEQLRYDAYHDSLTKLPNRLQFMDALTEAIIKTQKVDDYKYAVLFADLDRFKVINDSLGHLVGDELLREAAQRLKAVVEPQGGVVGRFGGDEFIILLRDLETFNQAETLAEQLQAEFRKPFRLRAYEVCTGLSIGITFSTNNYQEPADVLRDADIAMYQAKANGRGRYEVFDPSMQALAMSRLQLEQDLQKAIERKELRLFFQPIVSLSTGEITGFESLVRWQHSNGQWISPAKFIPVAEETGSIKQIGQWVMENAFAQTRIWYDRFPERNLVVNINISPLQLNQAGLCESISELHKYYNLPRRAIKLEITESSLLGVLDTEVNALINLRQAGTKLCIDDFGTGYSSLSRLHELPTDTLKIDRSFLNRMISDNGGLALVRTIITLARGLNMDVVAEGIETAEQLAILQSLSCDYGQGYLFHKPSPAEVVTELLQHWQTDRVIRGKI
ncbi:MAG: EAL domain-containing protein [Pseudanabaenaceae cyanobacterium SKYGB_i_bin29]|nr:EAL domain-containing protein [Pseudanabaenaceae cyanobacterium SKYG29]MDW8422530.1 EAL domain-containing protein [Pseudanabaenaceae cyanobacterium SKYGB_i_bin29]